MKFNNTKFAFTMAEMMVCLAIISVLATILIPTFNAIKPDKNRTMFKKTYGVAERVINEIVNDPKLYPATDIYVGFDNTQKVTIGDQEYGTSDELEIDYPDNYDELSEEAKQAIIDAAKAIADDKAKKKFCQVFATRVNKSSGVDCSSHSDATIGDGFDLNITSFATSDGVFWVLPYTHFMPTEDYQAIWIDVNGSKPPNTMDSIGSPAACPSNANVDQFEILVRADGKMMVVGACAQKYLEDMNLMSGRD